MKLVRFTVNGTTAIGALSSDGNSVVDLSVVAGTTSMSTFLGLGEQTHSAAKAAVHVANAFGRAGGTG